jgi:isocitrate/isopropylmalate dehydrogenase
VIHRSNCRAVAEYAFRTARQVRAASSAAVFGAAAAGIRTPDLKGHAGTTEYPDAVIERVRDQLA